MTIYIHHIWSKIYTCYNPELTLKTAIKYLWCGPVIENRYEIIDSLKCKHTGKGKFQDLENMSDK